MVSEPEGSLVLRVESSYSRKTLAARTAELQAISMAYNIPAPEPMDMKGDVYNNWIIFRAQWENYEIAIRLDEKDEKIRVATDYHG